MIRPKHLFRMVSFYVRLGSWGIEYLWEIRTEESNNNNNNNNNIIYIALYTKVLKRFTMEEETRIIKLTLPKK